MTTMLELENILIIKPVAFKVRLRKSLIASWFFVYIVLLIILSFVKPIVWSIIILLIGLFVWMNYKAMKYFVTNIEMVEQEIKLTYMRFDEQMPTLKIPIKDLSIDYVVNGKGISSLVSDHIIIGQKEKVIIRQHKAPGWTKDIMKSTISKLAQLIRK